MKEYSKKIKAGYPTRDLKEKRLPQTINDLETGKCDRTPMRSKTHMPCTRRIVEQTDAKMGERTSNATKSVRLSLRLDALVDLIRNARRTRHVRGVALGELAHSCLGTLQYRRRIRRSAVWVHWRLAFDLVLRSDRASRVRSMARRGGSVRSATRSTATGVH